MWVRAFSVGNRQETASGAAGPVSLTAYYLPSFLRWTRVRRSSLRCFFFDMRLRRFLMTEPINSAAYLPTR